MPYTQGMATACRICPRCLAEYDAAQTHCASDGRKLVETDPDWSPEIKRTIDDKVTLIGQLGSGGMGTVYRAIQHSMEREVAVKVLNPELCRDEEVSNRFIQEATAASHLMHPHVITLFDFGRSESGELYIIMELLKGHTLGETLSRTGRLSAGRALRIATQICAALKSAHDAGLVHRDLKPDNVFLCPGAGTEKDFVKVLDFGVAKILDARESMLVTQSGAVCGTPAYMSPEQVLGQGVDARTDLYALGLVLYEMLSGERPIVGDTPVSVMMAHVHDEAPKLREVMPEAGFPRQLELLLVRTLAKSPDDRPRNASQLKSLLIRAQDAVDTAPISETAHTLETPVSVPTLVGKAQPPNPPSAAAEPASAAVEPASAAAAPVSEEPPAVLSDAPPSRYRFLLFVAVVALLILGAFQLGQWLSDSSPEPPPEGSRADAGGSGPVVAPRPNEVPSAPAKVESGPSSTEPAERRPAEGESRPEVDRKPAPAAVAAEAQASSASAASPAPQPEIKGAAPTSPTPVEAVQPTGLGSVGTPPKVRTTRIVTVPAGAEVWEGKVRLGKTPLDLSLPKGDQVRRLQVRRKGYTTIPKPLRADTPDQVLVRMSRRKRPKKAKKTPAFVDKPGPHFAK